MLQHRVPEKQGGLSVHALYSDDAGSFRLVMLCTLHKLQVRDLARLSLRDPEYLAVHAEAGAPTPAKLQQAVMEVALPQKLDALWSFVKAHLRVGAVTAANPCSLMHIGLNHGTLVANTPCRPFSDFQHAILLRPQAKVIVFMSTCNQVRYAYEALRRLRPGVPLRALHGKMKQMKRLAAFYDFCEVWCCCSGCRGCRTIYYMQAVAKAAGTGSAPDLKRAVRPTRWM